MTKLSDSKLDFLNKRLDASIVKYDSYTTTERDLIQSEAGMIIYNSTNQDFEGNDGTSWKSFNASIGPSYGQFDAIINGTTYSTVQEAVADGKRNILIAVNTTDNVQIDLAGDVKITLQKDLTWTLNSTINYDTPGERRYFETNCDASSTIVFNNYFSANFNNTCYWIHNGGNINVPNGISIVCPGQTFVSNTEFLLDSSNISIRTGTGFNEWNNIKVTGIGSGADIAFDFKVGNYSNFEFAGTWTNNRMLFQCEVPVNISNFFANTGSSCNCELMGNITNLRQSNTTTLFVKLIDDDINLTNFQVDTLWYGYTNVVRHTNVKNGKTNTILGMTELGCENNTLECVEVTTDLTASGSKNRFISCSFTGNFGINSTAVNTMVIGTTASTFTDAGTGSVFAANISPVL